MTPDRPSSRIGWLCLPALLVAALIPNILWIIRDHTPWPWDQAWYGEVSVDIWFYLRHLSMRAWATNLLEGINMKPPGIVWLGQLFVPFGSWFGSVESALLFSVLVTQAVTLYVIFKIGRAIAPKSLGVPALGVSIAAAAPAFVGLSHQFFVEPLQALAVAWTVLVAVRATEWPAARTLLHLACAALLGVLAKATTPVYCAVPYLYIGFVLLRKPFLEGWRKEWRSHSGRALTIGLVAALPPTVAWYGLNLRAVWQHVREASSGEIALQYGSRAPVAAKFVVWSKLLYHSFLAPYLGWLVALAVVMGVVARLVPSDKRPAPRPVWLIALLCALQCGLLLLIFSMNDAVDSRYMYAMVGLLAVMVMSILAPVTSRAALAVLFAICALQFITLHRIVLGSAEGPGDQFEWLTKPHEDPARYREMERVVGITSTVAGRYNVVGVEEPWFNANTAAFFTAKHQLDTGIRCYYTGLGYAEKDADKALKRVDELNTLYFITLDENSQTKPPNFVNLVALPVLRRIEVDPHYRQVPFSTANGVVIFRRN